MCNGLIRVGRVFSTKSKVSSASLDLLNRLPTVVSMSFSACCNVSFSPERSLGVPIASLRLAVVVPVCLAEISSVVGLGGPKRTEMHGPESSGVSGPESTGIDGPESSGVSGPESTGIDGPKSSWVSGPERTKVDGLMGGPESTRM